MTTFQDWLLMKDACAEAREWGDAETAWRECPRADWMLWAYRATADTGNAGPADARRFDIAYPEAVGGAIVASAEGLPAAQWMAKEEWLRAMLHRELDEGRNVLIFLWHKELADRLQKLCRSVGETPAFLDAAKVPAKKRQDWIDKHVVGKRRILITNPSCVQTGLNNLIWFASAVFVENPGCNPFVARQAVGRLDRITQTKEVRIYWPVYDRLPALGRAAHARCGRRHRALHACIAQRLRDARTAKNYTYGELARLAGIPSRQTVYNIEAGRQVASIEQVAKLATALGVSPAWLAFGEGKC